MSSSQAFDSPHHAHDRDALRRLPLETRTRRPCCWRAWARWWGCPRVPLRSYAPCRRGTQPFAQTRREAPRSTSSTGMGAARTCLQDTPDHCPNAAVECAYRLLLKLTVDLQRSASTPALIGHRPHSEKSAFCYPLHRARDPASSFALRHLPRHTQTCSMNNSPAPRVPEW